MAYESLTRMQLQPGQTWRVAADARTSVQVLRGRVLLREISAWAAGGLPAAGIPLAEGQAHRLLQAGWIELAACGEAEILSYREPGWLARAIRACGLRIGALTGATA